MEWSIAEQASNAFSLCVVPLYETLGPDAVAFIINQAEIHTVVCSSDKIEKLASQADKMPCLKCIVSMDTPTEPQSQAAEKAGLKLHAFSELEEAGAASPVDPDPPKPEEYSTICYTSGTTGMNVTSPSLTRQVTRRVLYSLTPTSSLILLERS